jgi:hypothetical protein
LPPDDLQIVLDENLPWSIAVELKSRGYTATSNYALNASGVKDPEWLEIVAHLSPPAVLVTFDNAMPVEHEAWLRSLGVTLAVIASDKRPPALTPEQYWRDVIHRNCHRIATQQRGSWWRYRQATRRRLDLE